MNQRFGLHFGSSSFNLGKICKNVILTTSSLLGIIGMTFAEETGDAVSQITSTQMIGNIIITMLFFGLLYVGARTVQKSKEFILVSIGTMCIALIYVASLIGGQEFANTGHEVGHILIAIGFVLIVIGFYKLNCVKSTDQLAGEKNDLIKREGTTESKTGDAKGDVK